MLATIGLRPIRGDYNEFMRLSSSSIVFLAQRNAILRMNVFLVGVNELNLFVISLCFGIEYGSIVGGLEME
jgi:hypothetical protein